MATINQVVEEMQKRYPEASAELKEITKTNETLTGLTIHTAGEPVSPTMYLNEEEIERLELNVVCDGLQKTYEDHKGVIDPEIISDIRSFEMVADKIKVKAINTEWNKGFLSGVPSLKFADLSLIFYIDLGGNFKNCGTATVTVTDEIAGIWGKSVEEIYTVAAENTRKETAILRMGEVLREAGYEDLTPPGSPELLIITNKDRLNGGGGVTCCSGSAEREAREIPGDPVKRPRVDHPHGRRRGLQGRAGRTGERGYKHTGGPAGAAFTPCLSLG